MTVLTVPPAMGIDDTAAVQATIDTAQTGDTVLVPAGKYMINALPPPNDLFASGGVFLKSDMTLQLAAGAVLQAIPNHSAHYTILTAKSCHNLNILGPGSIIGDRDLHVDYPPGVSQWGFGIAIWGGCDNVVVKNLNISKLWGDGLTIIGAKGVIIDHVVTDSCRRQNMSVIDVDGLKITNCSFRRAQFSGLDLEADTVFQTISNVLIQYNSFTGTVEGPAHIGVGSAVGTYKRITIKDCQFDLRIQPIFVHDKAGNLGTPWYAFLRNRIWYQWLHAPSYRFSDYPQSWSSAVSMTGA